MHRNLLPLIGLGICVGVCSAAPAGKPQKPAPARATPQPSANDLDTIGRYDRFLTQWLMGVAAPLKTLPTTSSDKPATTQDEQQQLFADFCMISLMCKGIQVDHSRLTVPAQFKQKDQLLMTALKDISDAAEDAKGGDPDGPDRYRETAQKFGKIAIEISDMADKLEKPQ